MRRTLTYEDLQLKVDTMISIDHTLHTELAFTDSAEYWFNDKYGSKTKSDIMSILGVLRNYTKLLTGKSIPVLFDDLATTGSTNGQVIKLPTYFDLDHIDPLVGLVLHESSHIKYTNFGDINLMTKWYTKTKKQKTRVKNPFDIVTHITKRYGIQIPNITSILQPRSNTSDPINMLTSRNVQYFSHTGTYDDKSIKLFRHFIFPFINIIEDFYIDSLTYDQYDAYQQYYESLQIYNTKDVNDGKGIFDFLNLSEDDIISNDEMIKNKMKSNFTLFDLYIANLLRIFSIHNDLSTLPLLNKMKQMINIKTISRLKTTKDRIRLGIELADLVIGECKTTHPEGFDINDYNTENNDSHINDQIINALKDLSNKGDKILSLGAETDDVVEIPEAMKELLESLSSEQVNAIDRIFNDMTKDEETLLNNNKNTNSVTDNLDVQTFSPINGSQGGPGPDNATGLSRQDITSVNQSILRRDIVTVRTSIPSHVMGDSVVDIKEIESVLFTDPKEALRFVTVNDDNKVSKYSRYLSSGIAKGKSMSSRLQFLNTDRVLRTTRLNTGKIDKKLLSSIGVQERFVEETHIDRDANVFYNDQIDKYDDYVYYLDLDMSWSMMGSEYKMLNFIGILMGTFDLLHGVNLVVNGRFDRYEMKGKRSNEITMFGAYTQVLYDSRQHTLTEGKKMISSLFKFESTTPEETIYFNTLELMKRDRTSAKKIMISLTDGEPNGGILTVKEHDGQTGRRRVNANPNFYKLFKKKMDRENFDFFCFFLTKGRTSPPQTFLDMYGKVGYNIPLDNVTKISKVINKQIKQIHTVKG